jgi:hypothetical protein
MQPLLVVNPFQERPNVRQHIRKRIELQQIHALAFEAPKERFNLLAQKTAPHGLFALRIVSCHANPTHADLHAMLLEHPNVPFARIL